MKEKGRVEKSGEGKGGGVGGYSEELREEMIHYFGLAVREYFLVEEISFKNDMVVLEVGVGSGKAIELLKGRVREFWGVDKSVELIEVLEDEYRVGGSEKGDGKREREEESPIQLISLDICDEWVYLGKKFDVVFSLDTLEHVDYPERFFSFVARHLKRREEGGGLGVIIFPNECQDRHHGVTWFGKKGELLRLIEEAGLEMAELKELQMTSWHQWIKKLFWEWPKWMVVRYFRWRQDLGGEGKRNINDKREAGEENSVFPQEFDETFSFRIRKGLREGSKIKRLLLYGLSLYASLISWLIRRRPIYVKKELAGDDIRNKRLLILVKLTQRGR